MAEIVVKLVNGELAGKTMQGLTKEVNAAAQALKKAEIGTQQWVDANKKLEDTKRLQGDLKKQIDGTTSASNLLKSAWNKLPGAQYFNQIGDSIGMAKSGVGGLVSNFGVLKSAIAATGIGLLLIAAGALYSLFQNFTPVIDKVEQILGGISAVVNELVQRFQNLGSGLLDIITGTPGGVDKLAASFDGLAESVKGAYEAGVELATLQQDLDDLNRGIAITNAEQEQQVNRLILQSKNRSLSLAEQNELLRQAKQIAEENFAANDKLGKDNLKALIMEAQQKSKLTKDEILQLAAGTLAQETEYQKRGTISDELLQKITDAQVKVIQAEGATNALKEKISNREAAISEKQEAERDKRLADELKRKETLAKAEEKSQQDQAEAAANLATLKVEIMDEGLQKEMAQIELDTQTKIAALVGTEQQITEQAKLLQQQRDLEVQAVKDQFATEQAAKDEAARLEAFELALATDQNELSERLLAGQITEMEFAQLSAQNAMAYQQQKLELIRAAHGEQSKEYQAANAELLAMQQSAADLAVATKQQEMKDQKAALMGALGTFGDFFGALAGMQQRGTAQWKAFATASAIMSTIQGAINAYTSTAAIPIVGGALAPIAAGLALAAGMMNVRKIQNTKVEAPVKKALGGPLYGPSHSQGGIPIEAEGGEFIFSRRAVQAIGMRNLMLTNDHFTRKFAAGGPVDPFATAAKTGMGDTAAATGGISSQLEAFLMKNFEAINARMDRIKVINVVGETDEGIKTLNTIKEDADL
jgi:hypothetical protein